MDGLKLTNNFLFKNKIYFNYQMSIFDNEIIRQRGYKNMNSLKGFKPSDCLGNQKAKPPIPEIPEPFCTQMVQLGLEEKQRWIQEMNERYTKQQIFQEQEQEQEERKQSFDDQFQRN